MLYVVFRILLLIFICKPSGLITSVGEEIAAFSAIIDQLLVIMWFLLEWVTVPS